MPSLSKLLRFSRVATRNSTVTLLPCLTTISYFRLQHDFADLVLVRDWVVVHDIALGVGDGVCEQHSNSEVVDAIIGAGLPQHRHRFLEAQPQSVDIPHNFWAGQHRLQNNLNPIAILFWKPLCDQLPAPQIPAVYH